MFVIFFTLGIFAFGRDDEHSSSEEESKAKRMVEELARDQ